MPIGATHPMHTSKGYIKRILWYSSFHSVYSNFYNLMRDEANPISQQTNTRINQLNHAYYWKGAVVTYGTRSKSKRAVIEVQHSDKNTLGSLVNELIEELGEDNTAKFNTRTIIGEKERSEGKR